MKRTGLKVDPAKVREWQDRSRKPLARGAFWKTRAGTLRRKTALAKRNVQRAAKRAKAYRTVIASDFHKQLRYAAFLRSGGLCECERCRGWRSHLGGHVLHAGSEAEMQLAWQQIPVWFTARGKEPWQRFRSTDGELHHVSYKHFGNENPDELRLVQWVWRDCHKRIEASQNTRRRYLATGK